MLEKLLVFEKILIEKMLFHQMVRATVKTVESVKSLSLSTTSKPIYS